MFSQIFWTELWQNATAFPLPCFTRVGLYTPSGVIKLWYSCDPSSRSSCQYLWHKSIVAKHFLPANLAMTYSRSGMAHAWGIVCLLTGRRSVVKRNFSSPSLGIIKAAHADERDRFRRTRPNFSSSATFSRRNWACAVVYLRSLTRTGAASDFKRIIIDETSTGGSDTNLTRKISACSSRRDRICGSKRTGSPLSMASWTMLSRCGRTSESACRPVATSPPSYRPCVNFCWEIVLVRNAGRCASS